MFSKDLIGFKGLRMEICREEDISLGEQGMAGSNKKMKVMEEGAEYLREAITHCSNNTNYRHA